MDKISTVIIDDDSLFRTIVKGFIEKTDSLNLVESFESPVKAINYINNNQIDLIFLDIEMPEMNGLQFIKALEYKPQIILITSNEAYAVDAFEYNVTDYLLKPLDDYSRFLKAVSRAKEILATSREVDYMFIKEDSKFVKIKFADIDFVEAYGDYVKIHTSGHYHITLATLKSISNKLPDTEFLQIHRSYLIRLDKVESIEGNNVNIKENRIPFSKTMRDVILDRIMN